MDLVVKTIAQVYILQAMLMYTNALYGSFLSSPCTEEFTNNFIVRKENYPAELRRQRNIFRQMREQPPHPFFVFIQFSLF